MNRMGKRAASFTLSLTLSLGWVTSAICAGVSIPTSTFFRYAEYTQVKISPDGRYLAVVSVAPGDELPEQLTFIDTRTMRVTAHYHVIGEQMIYELWWVNNDRVVFTTATQTGSLDRPLLTGDIWAINVDGGNLQTLAYHFGQGIANQYHYNSVVYISPNSPHEILMLPTLEKESDLK